MNLAERIAQIEVSLADFIVNPETISELEPEEQLDILALMQHRFELRQALVRQKHSEHSWQYMEAHADVNYWKNKVMNAKVQARVKIADKERGL